MSAPLLALCVWTLFTSLSAAVAVGICVYRSWRGSPSAYRALPGLTRAAFTLVAANVLALVSFAF